jgi:hypothetical protein
VQNSAEEVEAATRVALTEATTEPARMKALRSLRGVDWPTASVLLHLASPERQPILDVRALHALGVRPAPAYSFHFWNAYRTAWPALRERAGVDGRTLDRGLWQWSKEQETPLYADARVGHSRLELAAVTHRGPPAVPSGAANGPNARGTYRDERGR